jgi:hypothetical protein
MCASRLLPLLLLLFDSDLTAVTGLYSYVGQVNVNPTANNPVSATFKFDTR